MKKYLFVFALGAAVLLLFAGYGCAKRQEYYGSKLSQMQATSAADILKHPDNFIGKDVRLEGKIVRECPAGGWFMLNDGTGVIFVNMHPTGVVIPQAVGSRVATQGKVKKELNQISVIGEGVEFK